MGVLKEHEGTLLVAKWNKKGNLIATAGVDKKAIVINFFGLYLADI